MPLSDKYLAITPAWREKGGAGRTQLRKCSLVMQTHGTITAIGHMTRHGGHMTHHMRGGHGGARDGVSTAIVPGRGHIHSLSSYNNYLICTENAAYIAHC